MLVTIKRNNMFASVKKSHINRLNREYQQLLANLETGGADKKSVNVRYLDKAERIAQTIRRLCGE